MDIKSFSNKRFLTMINQSYNFDKEIVFEVSKIALEKGLISSESLKSILKKNEEKRIIKKETNYLSDKNIHFEDPKKSIFPKKYISLIQLVVLIASIFLFFKTGFILFIGLGSASMASSIFSKKRYFKR